MSPIIGLFNIFSLLYVFRSLQLTALIWREWREITPEPLTRHKKHLAEQASFFIAVPVGVALHEFGHALAIWLFGGRVVEFGYRVFWGYVVPQGVFTPTQEWFISLAGTLGSLIYGVGLWLLLRHHPASALRYFALRAFRFQVYFSLIYYPVFTFILPIGDWRSIYNFQATPVLSGLTLVAHLILLGLFWWGDRIGWFEMPSHESKAGYEKFLTLAREAGISPDPKRQMQYIDALRRGDATNKARTQLRQFLLANPTSAEAYLQLAVLQSDERGQISRAASENAQKALHLGLSNVQSIALAHQLLGRYYLDRGEGEKATDYLNQAIATVSSRSTVDEQFPGDHEFLAYLYHLRSQAHRRQRHYELAYEDGQQAIAQAQAAGNDRSAAFYRSELEVIEKHAGRALGAPPPRAP